MRMMLIWTGVVILLVWDLILMIREIRSEADD